MIKLEETDEAAEENMSGIQGKKLVPLPDADQLR